MLSPVIVTLGAELRPLKKYANRKIYDSSARRYVTIRDISEMIRNHETVQVLDDKTGDDITRSVLLQIINDLEFRSESSVLTDYVLQNLIRMYGDPMGGTFAMYLDYSLKNYLQQKQSLNQAMESFMQASQLTNMQEFTTKMLETWSKLTGFKK